MHLHKNINTNLIVIGIEGLHRSGKGTQLSMLKEFFKKLGFEAEILRGDGSREGIGNPKYYDPVSLFWQNFRQKYELTYKETEKNIWDLGYNLLVDEFNNYCKIKERDKLTHAILLDRTYISRAFVLKQKGLIPEFPELQSQLYITPELYFVLDVKKSELLRRNSLGDSDKKEFRHNNIEKYFDMYQETIFEIPEKIKSRIKIVSGETEPHIIQEELRLNILNLLKNGKTN